VPKHARSLDGFDEQILALYAGGMTTRDIQRHLRELYSVEVSEGLISEVSSSIQDDVRAWQSRPLEELYVVVYLDAMMVSIREQQVVKKRAVHVAIGITLAGERECLGLWVEKTEGARFWTSVMSELKNRGVHDILFVCTDGLSGFPETIDAVFPKAVNQTCVVHLVRQSLKYLSYQERKTCASQLRRIYTAPDADAALAVLDELTRAWADSPRRSAALEVWRRAWQRFIPFLAFPGEIRRIIYTTNAVESLHAQIRKTIKTRGHFPNDEAAIRLVWLSIQRAKKNWHNCYNWSTAMSAPHPPRPPHPLAPPERLALAARADHRLAATQRAPDHLTLAAADRARRPDRPAAARPHSP
jgi:putative transposase